jgi:hypothetical protein
MKLMTIAWAALTALALTACGGAGGGETATRQISPFVSSQVRMAQIASRAATTDELYQFFAVAFNAAPGFTYMGQLNDAANAGMTTRQIVNVFTTKSQFTDTYPISLSDAEFADKLVANVVGSSATVVAKASAVNDVVGALAIPGWTRGDVIYAIFTNLAGKPSTDADWAGTARQLKDQVVIAKTYTEVFKVDTTDLAQLRKVVIPRFAVMAAASSTAAGSVANGVAINMLQALFGMAPSNAMLIDLSAQAAADPSTFVRNFSDYYASTSDSDLASLVLTNLGVTVATVNPTAYPLLLDAVGQIFAAYGPASRGRIILNLADLLSGLESDATYGAAAVAYNRQFTLNFEYGSNAANTTPGPVAPIAGTVTGLTSGGLVLTAGGQTLALKVNSTSFLFMTSQPPGSSFKLAVQEQAAGLTCSVRNGTGKLPVLIPITIACLPGPPSFSGTVAVGAGEAAAEISLRDMEGQVDTAISDSRGDWFIPFSKIARKLTPPFVVRARFRLAGKNVDLFSISTDDAGGNIRMNITPWSDMITRAYVWPSSNDPNLVEGLPNNPGKLSQIMTGVREMAGPLLPKSAADFIKDPLTPDPRINEQDALIERTRILLSADNITVADVGGRAMATRSLSSLSQGSADSSDAGTVSKAEADMAIAAKGDFPGVTPAVVNEGYITVESVSPVTANPNQLTTFTVKGSNFIDSMLFSLESCSVIREIPGGTSTVRQYSCTPIASGAKVGVILDSSGGTSLYTFHVQVSAGVDPNVACSGVMGTYSRTLTRTDTASNVSLPLSGLISIAINADCSAKAASNYNGEVKSAIVSYYPSADSPCDAPAPKGSVCQLFGVTGSLGFSGNLSGGKISGYWRYLDPATHDQAFGIF